MSMDIPITADVHDLALGLERLHIIRYADIKSRDIQTQMNFESSFIRNPYCETVLNRLRSQ